MASIAQKPDNSLPMGGMDHAAMGHGAKSAGDHAAMGHDAKPVDHVGMGHAPPGGGTHTGHGDMVSDFRRRFWVCFVLTVPVLLLSPLLKARGVRSIMIPGDAEGVAKSGAKELGLDEYFAQVLPDQKAAKERALQARGLKVAMVGDRVNDAPALVEAILGLSRATYAKMVQNQIWATGYNAFAIPMAAGITFGTGFLMTPAIGAVFMSAFTTIVAINAQLLRRYRG